MIQKLKQQNGSSLIFALVLFLICIMVSSSVVVAASSGSSRNVSRTEKQQSYLAVGSAAELLMDELTSVGEFVGRAEKNQYACSDYAKDGCKVHYTYVGLGTEVVGYKFEDCTKGMEATILPELCVSDTEYSHRYMDESSSVQGILKSVIEEAALAVFSDTNMLEYTTTFTIDVEDERLPEVQCKFTMKSNFNIAIVVSTAVSDYSVTIYLDGNVEEDRTIITEPLSCTHVVYYKVLEGDHYVPRVDENYAFTTGLKYVERTMISWDAPELMKGDATQ